MLPDPSVVVLTVRLIRSFPHRNVRNIVIKIQQEDWDKGEKRDESTGSVVELSFWACNLVSCKLIKFALGLGPYFYRPL